MASSGEPKQELPEFPLNWPVAVKIEASTERLGFEEVVEISSSTEKSTTSEEVGEEATSPAILTPNGKRATSLDYPTIKDSADYSRKKPKLQSSSRGIDSFDHLGGTLETQTFHVSGFLPTSGGVGALKTRISDEQEKQGAAELPADFLEPLELQPSVGGALHTAPAILPSASLLQANNVSREIVGSISRQFWKAGDYESFHIERKFVAGGMDHIRVHPKFLHSNATSHKWALGAVAELLDNAMDEAVNGATVVNVDMIRNPRDGSPMLLIEDDGGGMNPDRMRQCMSLGYSAKSKIANTIGQYGNGFKTSTMRLGADVIVFSRSPGTDGSLPTQSIGMLSYTFLTHTGQEDIIVPMVDYEAQPFGLRKLMRGNLDDWNKNMKTILQWSPYETEFGLLDQLQRVKHQGTVVILYNLWEDDQGEPELDFDADPYDIQLRGTNRDEKNISMANRFPNCKHYFTYRYSLRSYVSILYLRLPVGFRIILRGKEVEHHSLVNDLMFAQELTYRPQGRSEQAQRENRQMMAVVTVGFLKDAKEHIDVQGFNVYHKNRLIKPFWRVWNLPGIQGRGIIGVLEADFIEPAHDKQGFERTIILARLETRLLEIQKNYWSKNCQMVGYVNNSLKKSGKPASKANSSRDDKSPEKAPQAMPDPLRAPWTRPVSEVQVLSIPLAVTKSSSSQSILAQPHTRAASSGTSIVHETGIRPVPEVQSPSIPLVIKRSSGSQSISAQPHVRAASSGTGTVHAAAAVPTSTDRQEPLENSSVIPFAVTRSLRSPMQRIPAQAYQNHVASPGTSTILEKDAAPSPPTRQIPFDEGPPIFSGVSMASQSHVHHSPAQAHQTGTTSRRANTTPQVDEISSVISQTRLDTTQFAVARSLRSQSQRISAEANQTEAMPLTTSTIPEAEALVSMEPLPMIQSEVPESPPVICRTSESHISPTNLQPTISKSTRLQQRNLAMQTKSLLELGQSFALMTEATEKGVKRACITDGCNDANGDVGVSLDGVNASHQGFEKLEAEPPSLPTLIKSNRQLEAKIKATKQRIQMLQKDLEQAVKERDYLNEELQEERKRKELDDEELRKKLQTAISRARELGAENKLLHGAQG